MCTVQLYSRGKYKYRIGTGNRQILNLKASDWDKKRGWNSNCKLIANKKKIIHFTPWNHPQLRMQPISHSSPVVVIKCNYLTRYQRGIVIITEIEHCPGEGCGREYSTVRLLARHIFTSLWLANIIQHVAILAVFASDRAALAHSAPGLSPIELDWGGVCICDYFKVHPHPMLLSSICIINKNKTLNRSDLMI